MLLQFSQDRERACERFVTFVLVGAGINIWVNLRQQIYLGDDQFVSDQQQYIEKLRMNGQHRSPSVKSMEGIARNYKHS
ncbi:hypothetical protein ACTL6P_22475 [Endozoicomonas acroporae]|uniref:hypothetical protein n=1 Tax=Endozoicomonas acroporae TaxID=1701104 RepID=UPI000C7717A3|nr:hypothetical protein [Endozoicomonas acroporae]